MNLLVLPSPPREGRRAGRWSGWGVVVPGILLALLPTCPACLAAWIAVGTGTAVSVAVADKLYTGLVIVCLGTLSLFLVKGTCRIFRRHQARK